MSSLRTSPVLTAVLFTQLSFAGVAAASPPTFDKTQAVAGPRSDAGTGLCGSVTHFLAAQPLSNKTDAAALADKPSTDSMILDRTSRLFGSINLRNGQSNTAGDFTQPTYPDAVLPYSKDPAAMPMGTDSNLVVRLRGYLNIPAALTGKIISFGVNCDDFCSLQIGKTAVVPMADERISARVIRQASFKDPGLYPVELLYYQNGSTAFLEWSRTDVAVQECPNDICLTSLTDPVMYQSNFKLLTAAELYSSISGASSTCQECGSGTSCAAGSYCGDGLCQQCNTADHCGTSCQACPSTARTCSTSGQCVECATDAQCGSGATCDAVSGKCKTPAGSTDNPSYTGGSGCAIGSGGSSSAAKWSGAWSFGSFGLLLALGLLARRRRHYQPN